MSEPPPTYTREGLYSIITVLPVAVMVMNHDFSVVLANPAALKFTEKSRDQVLGQVGGSALGCVNAVPNGCGFGLNCAACTLRETLTTTLKKNRPLSTVETAMDIGQKGVRILRFSTLPLVLEERQVLLVTIEDLTEARTHEQEHLEKEKLAAVLETTGGVCHELSQPLQVIMGYRDILAGYPGLDQDISQALVAISAELDKIVQLVHDLNHITHYKTKPYLKTKIIDIQQSSSRRPDKNKKSP